VVTIFAPFRASSFVFVKIKLFFCVFIISGFGSNPFGQKMLSEKLNKFAASIY